MEIISAVISVISAVIGVIRADRNRQSMVSVGYDRAIAVCCVQKLKATARSKA